MTFKNIDDRREYQKKWIAKKRKRQKEGQENKTEKFENITSGFTLELTIHSGSNPMTAEQQAQYEELKQLIQKVFVNATVEEIKRLFEDSKAKKSFCNVMPFIPNLLSLGNDLQMLKHRGGTA